MSKSPLQDSFLRELAVTFRATQKRIERRQSQGTVEQASAILEDELRGLFHGLLVTFDGGSALADEGLISIVDENGNAFDRNLHEFCFDFWPKTTP